MSADGAKGFDRYQVERCLAERHTAVVYSARDTLLDRIVALKCPKPGLIAEKPQYRDVFVREARHLAHLDHPNVVPLYEYYEGPNGPVLVMRFAASDLERVGRTRSPGTLAELGDIALDVARAIDYCNEQGIAHRDIKPDNILVGGTDEIYLSDFGIAAALDDHERWEQPEGAKAFLSPETFTDQYTGGRSDRRRRCDQFSFGVTLYYMLTGSLPYAGVRNRNGGQESEWDDCTALRLLRGEAPTPCSDRKPTLPAAVNDVISRMLSIEPNDRYGSNTDAARALEEALSGHTSKEPKVFLSYGRHDSAIVDELAAGLTRGGFHVSWDRNVEYGSYWEDSIEAAMEESDVMLVLLSPASAASSEVKNEWRYWTSCLKKPLITVILEDCKLPYRLFSRQHISAAGRPTEEVLGDIAKAARRAVRSSGSGTTTEPTRDGFGAAPESGDASTNDVTSAFSSHSALRNLTLVSLFSMRTGGLTEYVPKRYRFATLPVDVQSILRQLKAPK